MKERFKRAISRVAPRIICGAAAILSLALLLSGCMWESKPYDLYNVKWVSSEPEIEFFGYMSRKSGEARLPASFEGYIVVEGEYIRTISYWSIGGGYFEIFLLNREDPLISERKVKGRSRYYRDERKVVVYDIGYDEWFDYRYSEIVLYAVDLTPAEREEVGLDPYAV